MSQSNTNRPGPSQSLEPHSMTETPILSSLNTTFSNQASIYLASPQSAYSPNHSPNSALLMRRRSNSPPLPAAESSYTFPSPNEASSLPILSPSQPSPAARAGDPPVISAYLGDYRANSPSSRPSNEHLVPGEFRSHSAYRPHNSPSSAHLISPVGGLSIAAARYRDSGLSAASHHDIMSDYSDDGKTYEVIQRSFDDLRRQAGGEDSASDSEFDSPARLREQEERREQEAAERAFRRHSQNPHYSHRTLPPPETIEVPTAQDVRFGLKGVRSAGLEEVKRGSMLRIPSNSSENSKQSWRSSFFGNSNAPAINSKELSQLAPGLTSCSAEEFGQIERKKVSELKNNKDSLSIMVEDDLVRHPRTPSSNPGITFNPSNPYAKFVRPISVAPDENLRMMRGDRSDPNPTPMRFYPSLNGSGSHASFGGFSVISGTGSTLSNAFPKTAMQDGSSPHHKEFDYLPDNFDMFDFREAEADDALHDPGPALPRKGVDRMIIETKMMSGHSTVWSSRGWLNALGLLVLAATLVTLFAGFPIVDYFIRHPLGRLGGYNIGGINATGQVPEIAGFRGLIDRDTPRGAMTKKGADGKDYQLVFSDEFNQDGRTFWPGDDPYWEAVDLHYWATSNLEWYDPDQIVTKNGSLAITLDKVADPSLNHGLDYKGGMLQSWNKFCFTGGIVEASISLPGDPTVAGLWPAFWTMGNLGRAGYGASLDGTWPYSYDTCDIGTLPNQTDPSTGGPTAVHTMGDPYHDHELSYLPGQRLSRCTCPKLTGSNSHPGPKHSDGTWVGRSAPEIDVLEGLVERTKKVGQVSQSAQFAPYNAKYLLNNLTDGYVTIYDDTFHTELNPYTGGIYQQAASGLSSTDQTSYDGNGFASYGFEYATSDSSNPYITWTQKDQAMWKITSGAVGPDPLSQIGQRIISNEPMYILLNLGISPSFGKIEFDKLNFPAKMLVDWVRVYQPVGAAVNINCSPPNYPTAQYISDHAPAYANPNLTTWEQYQSQRGDSSGNHKTGFPNNRLIDTC